MRRALLVVCVWLAGLAWGMEPVPVRMVGETACIPIRDIGNWLAPAAWYIDEHKGEMRLWRDGQAIRLSTGQREARDDNRRVLRLLPTAPFRNGRDVFVPILSLADFYHLKYVSSPREISIDPAYPDGRRLVIYPGTRRTHATEMLDATAKGNTERMQALLKADPSLVGIQDRNGRTPLHLALHKYLEPTVSQLLAAGAPIEARDIDGDTPLMTAANSGRPAMAALLFPYHPDVNAQTSASMHTNYLPRTALHNAVLMHDPAMVRLLLEHGADANARTVLQYTSLHLAAQGGDREILDLLLTHGAEVNALGDDNIGTPLHVAANMGHLEIAERLLAAGATVDAIDAARGETPLFRTFSPEFATLLLDHGAQINARRKDGWTPLHLVAYDGPPPVATHPALMEVLLAHGADVNARANGGGTPLLLAASMGHAGMVGLLLNHKADANIADAHGITPLQRAAGIGNLEIVQVLLVHGADVQATDDRGVTALHRAALCGSAALVRALLTAGADVDARTRNDLRTPLHEAARYGNTAAASALLDSGADVNAYDADGATPRYWAENKGFPATARLLATRGGSATVRYAGLRGPLVWAVKTNNFAEVRRLAALGYDLNAVDPHSCDRPLHITARRGNTRMSALLLDLGANIEQRTTNWDCSPLMIAAEQNQLAMVRLLLHRGANLHYHTDLGLCALHLAVFNGHAKMVEFLIARGLGPDDPYIPPLECAAFVGRLPMARQLLAHGAHINAQNREYGWTALHAACDRMDYAMAALLLRHGANPNLKDADGQTPMHSAAWRHDRKMLQLLQRYDGRMDARDRHGNTPRGLLRTPNYGGVSPLDMRFGGEL